MYINLQRKGDKSVQSGRGISISHAVIFGVKIIPNKKLQDWEFLLGNSLRLSEVFIYPSINLIRDFACFGVHDHDFVILPNFGPRNVIVASVPNVRKWKSAPPFNFIHPFLVSPFLKKFHSPFSRLFFTGRFFLRSLFIGQNYQSCMYNSAKFGSKYNKRAMLWSLCVSQTQSWK